MLKILLMAMCDVQAKFLWFEMFCIPTMHDNLAWKSTKLAHEVRNGKLRKMFFILGKNAFKASRSIKFADYDDVFNLE